jgi:hypothetical protein
MSSLASDFRMDTDVVEEVSDEEGSHVSDDVRGIPVTKGFSTSIQGNSSPIEFVESTHDDDANTSVDVDNEPVVIEAKTDVGGIVTLASVIAKRDEDYGDDYNGVKNEKFRDGQIHPGLRPRLQNIPALSKGVAEALSLFHYTAGKLPGGSWDLHFPKVDGKAGIERVVKNCKNESIFWDCVAQQVTQNRSEFFFSATF